MPEKRKQKHQQKPREHTDTALERIRILFAEADKSFPRGKALSDRYVALARKIATKYRVHIPGELKKRFCKRCGAFLKPAVNCRVRLNKGRVVYFCLNCGSCARFPYRKVKQS